MELNLIEEFLLIALDDEKGQFATDSTHLHYGFAGAILLELAIREKIQITNEKVELVSSAYEKEISINKAIDLIKNSDKNRKVDYWVNKLANKAGELKEDTLNSLMRKGILNKEDHKILWIIPNTKYPTQNITPENKIRKRLHDVMLEGAESSPRDIMLLSLIDVSELTREAFRNKEEYKVVKKKIKEVTQDIKISQVINKTIRDIQATVMPEVMSKYPTVTALYEGQNREASKVQKVKSTTFFTGLKKYINDDEKIKKNHLGIYDFELTLDTQKVNYQLDISEKTVTVRKKKTAKPLVKIEIDDENLINLYKKKLLIDEVMIQGRIKITGTKRNTDKFLKLLSQVLENN